MESLMKPYSCENASASTHLSLVGGKYKVTEPDRFHRIYAKMWTQGAYLVEKVWYPSRWYLDFDKVSPDFVNNILIPRLSRFKQCCVVCVCRDTWDGVHVIFPNVIVNDKSDARKWSDTFTNGDPALSYDPSVYSSGLRMIGSKKKRDVSRLYTPYVFVTDTVRVIEGESVTPKLLRLCSIHSDQACFDPPPFLPRSASSPMKKGGSEHESMKKLGARYYWFTKERYCENVNREHKSASRMYELDFKNKRMRIRCSCKCRETGCEQYRGPWRHVPIKLYDYIQNNHEGQGNRVHSYPPNIDVRNIDDFVDNLFG